MPPSTDTVIVGAGLAGACAAFHLSRVERVLVLEAAHPAAGASGAAAGLVNPLMGQKARQIWQADEALETLQATLAEADAPALFADTGLLRPASDAGQARIFRNVAQVHPNHAAWLSADAAKERFPGVNLCDGALLVRRGGAARVSAVVDALLTAARRQGATVCTGTRVTGWQEDGQGVRIQTALDEPAPYARRVLLTMGYGYRHHPALVVLNLHAIKGQTVRVSLPVGLRDTGLLPLSGQGYIVPDGRTLIVGSSYEHAFADLLPSATQTRRILAKAARMLPTLQETTVLGASAGVRVTVPGTRLPMLGPVPGYTRIWIFTGLSSKGLLMAPLLARNLPAFFERPETIPMEVQVH